MGTLLSESETRAGLNRRHKDTLRCTGPTARSWPGNEVREGQLLSNRPAATVDCVTSIQWPAVARAAFRGGRPGCFLKIGFGDFGTACATPSYVCSAAGPVTPNVALRAPECPFMADSRGSLCSPKAGFGRIRLLPRRAAYGLSCELTQPAISGPVSYLPDSGRSARQKSSSAVDNATHPRGDAGRRRKIASRRPREQSMRADRLIVCFLAAVALAGCASRPINEPITQVDPKSGYRPYLLIPKIPNNDPHTLFVLSFSGGGTRAAAFSYGVLEELRRTEIVVDGQAPPADRRGGRDHRRVGRKLHGARVCPLRRPAVLRVRGAVPQARRTGHAGRARLESV